MLYLCGVLWNLHGVPFLRSTKTVNSPRIYIGTRYEYGTGPNSTKSTPRRSGLTSLLVLSSLCQSCTTASSLSSRLSLLFHGERVGVCGDLIRSIR
jgi:hypothetical protein